MSAVAPPPRVLLVCDYFIRYETGLAQGLRAHGCDPALLGRNHQHAFGGAPDAMRAYLDARLGPDRSDFLLEGRAGDVRRWGSVLAAARWTREIRPSVTHVQSCIAHAPRLVFAARLRPRSYALTVHDVTIHPGDRSPRRRHRAIYSPMLRHAGVVFVHAETLREQLVARGATRAPIVVVPHGVDRAEPSPPPATPSLLLFGRVSRYKGIDVLLDAMTELWRQRAELPLTIAGEGPLPDHAALRDPRVRVLNRHILDSEIPSLFGAASVIVLPYLEASQSGVGSLAKGYGRPIVASRVGGLPELLADGSGQLVAPGDSGELARAIHDLLADPGRQEAMRRAALDTILAKAGWPAVAERVLEAYTQHLGLPALPDRVAGGA